MCVARSVILDFGFLLHAFVRFYTVCYIGVNKHIAFYNEICMLCDLF